MKTFLAFTCFAVLCSGCTTCRVAVGNATEKIITEVRVQAGGQYVYSQDAIESKEIGKYIGLKGEVPMASTLAWKDAEGKVQEREIQLAKKVPRRFTGRVLYEIGRDGNAKLFILDDDNGGSLIPWGFSEEFDGTVNMPGMNR